MTLGPYEAQLITASVLTIPGIVMVLIAVFTGQFSRKAETTKYAVFYEEPQEDFWEQDERYRVGTGAAPGGGRPGADRSRRGAAPQAGAADRRAGAPDGRARTRHRGPEEGES